MSSDTRILAEMTVDDVMARHPATMRVFNTFGVDSCCGAHSSVREAAERDGVDEVALLAALERAMQEPR
jgi:iron-sulfur cluster repair protein YtfE (RIC family)